MRTRARCRDATSTTARIVHVGAGIAAPRLRCTTCSPSADRCRPHALRCREARGILFALAFSLPDHFASLYSAEQHSSRDAAISSGCVME